jgi:hypothetical protein
VIALAEEGGGGGELLVPASGQQVEGGGVLGRGRRLRLRWLCRARPPFYSSALRAALFPPEEAHGQVAEHGRIGCEDQERRCRDEPLEHRVLDRFYRGA